jgi:hypothetical protein
VLLHHPGQTLQPIFDCVQTRVLFLVITKKTHIKSSNLFSMENKNALATIDWSTSSIIAQDQPNTNQNTDQFG